MEGDAPVELDIAWFPFSVSAFCEGAHPNIDAKLIDFHEDARKFPARSLCLSFECGRLVRVWWRIRKARRLTKHLSGVGRESGISREVAPPHFRIFTERRSPVRAPEVAENSIASIRHGVWIESRL